jgi:hypothetical protein
MVQKIMAIGAILAALAIPAGGLWWMAGFARASDEQAKEQADMAKAVKTLTAIHVRQETVSDAEKAMIKKLCDAGELKGAMCD